MKFYNTLSHQNEEFVPLDPANIKMYVCGPTVYDRVHLGNARPNVVFDTLYRLLKYRFPKVTYARNITDVDDKINTRAAELGIPIQALTIETTKYFHEDMEALNTLHPTIEPRATQHIPEMIQMIQSLISNGLAYEAEKHVLFSVAKDKSYGCLSRRNREDMIAGARVEVAPYKKDPADFVLWKPSEDNIPGWESPWGFGRPGWHIECSAMSTKYLTETFDIHGGGQDLIFPHHENEIAQSTGVYGPNTFAKVWMHNGMITVDGEKMAKSLGNFITVREALDRYPGEVIRYVLLSTHYRHALDWTETVIEQAKTCLNRLYTALRDAPELMSAEPSPEVLAALEDDLNTPLVFSKLFEITTAINKEENIIQKHQLQSTLKSSANMLGLLTMSAEKWFRGDTTASLDESKINEMIQAREQARKDKDFSKADMIRDDLLEMGIALEDTSEGTLWRRK